MKNLSVQDAFEQDATGDISDINKFVDDASKCEFIQVHPSMDYDDIVYGLQIKASTSLNMAYAEKRVMQLCNRAKGKQGKHCVIFDDINRADAGRLLGNVLYAMEYRNQDVELSDGKVLSIPDNVVLIFTENILDLGNGLDLAVRRRMTFLRELRSNRDAIQKYYRGILNTDALKLVLNNYDRVKDFVTSYINKDVGISAEDYVPGHCMYFVDKSGTPYFVLDNVRQKIRFQVAPYLRDLYSRGIITVNPDTFIEKILAGINVGITGLCKISSITKKLIKSGKTVSSFSLVDSRQYYDKTIVTAGCSDFRGMMECIIDALVLNKILPYDVLVGALLMNTSLAYIESLHTPVVKAAYMVEKHNANRFMYETVRGGKTSGTHAYYTLDVASTGRWQKENDTEEYILSYSDGTPDAEFIILSGFRNHGFSPDSPELGVQHNTVNIMSAVHILLSKYLELYKTNIGLVMGSDPNLISLYQLIELEEKYLECIKQVLKGKIKISSQPTGDSGRLRYYGERLVNLKFLWYGVGESLEIVQQKFADLVSEKIPFSMEEYENLYETSAGIPIMRIKIEGVLKMVDLKDYQKIMENIGIRQMIFQGPPGTSKTFESKRFVLSQLNPAATALSKVFASQEDISADLESYKLNEVDYANPKTSSKLISGGWDLVQFHPSYGYEDFIRGIEVKIPTGSTTPSYGSVNRILGRIAEFSKVAADSAGKDAAPKFYLIVDEINRANLATVFGELIYGLEYRNSKVSTPYEVMDKVSGTVTADITIGKNLFIIGTMNTADKSIDAIDYAIRRRFMFVDSPANREVVLKCYQNASGNADEDSIELLLFDAIQHIFDDERFFNTEYQKNDVKIGHTYFLRDRKKGYEDAAIEHFLFQVVPIMREYVKDGILDITENLVSSEHTVTEIHSASTGDEQISLLSENLMLYVKEFGNLNKSNVTIDNGYIGKFIDDLRKEFSY